MKLPHFMFQYFIFYRYHVFGSITDTVGKTLRNILNVVKTSRSYRISAKNIEKKQNFVNCEFIFTAIAKIIDVDIYDVEEILENWFEFLQHQVDKEITYTLYHPNFRNWLA